MDESTTPPALETAPLPRLGVPPKSAGWTLVNEAYHAGLRVAAARRARVLSHPDIAAMLTYPPLSLPTPALWTGFIPPAQIPRFSESHPYKMNRSPVRNQLVEVCRLVAEREAAEAESA